MKKRRPFRLRTSEFVFTFLVLFSGTMLAFSSGSFVVNFQRLGFSVVSTAVKGVNSVVNAVGNTFTAVKELSRLKKENEELTAKLENYEAFQREIVDIRRENEQLKELLGFSTKISQKNFHARIISRSFDGIHNEIIINKGSTSGIKKGMPVVAVQDGSIGLVGKIISVGIGTSVVMPVYDMQCYVSCRIQNTRDIGLVIGRGNVNFPLEMRYIKRRALEELNYGDIVVTSGENDNYYGGILVGTIAEIRPVDYDASLDIDIAPFVDFSRLENVIVTDLKELNPDYEGEN